MRVYEAKKVAGDAPESGTNLGMDAADDEPLLPGYLDRLCQIGLPQPELARVTQLLADVRAETVAAYVRKLDRAVVLIHEARAERDAARATLTAVEEVATARDYLPPYPRVPRFSMPGKEVLSALGVLERYQR